LKFLNYILNASAGAFIFKAVMEVLILKGNPGIENKMAQVAIIFIFAILGAASFVGANLLRNRIAQNKIENKEDNDLL